VECWVSEHPAAGVSATTLRRDTTPMSKKGKARKRAPGYCSRCKCSDDEARPWCECRVCPCSGEAVE